MEKEVSLLLDAIYGCYGYDFRNYAEAHLKRRLKHRMALSKVSTIDGLREKLLKDEGFAALLIHDLSITVTEMFRDADFYRALRDQVIPLLRTYSFIKIWHAGCSTGQEVYSMAILLKEEGLYDRATIYATDFNQGAIDQGKEGIYTLAQMKEYEVNYNNAGGSLDFSTYYTAKYENVILDQSLKQNIVWANHNLVTDSVFAEVQILLCRNVLIYFNASLQEQVHKLFYESLVPGGLLCLGSKESLRVEDIATKYMAIDKRQRIFKKQY